jgi:DNA-nicking Smr family endonuclease
MRRRREPSPVEMALWGEVARSVKPLKGRKAKAAAPPTSAGDFALLLETDPAQPIQPAPDATAKPRHAGAAAKPVPRSHIATKPAPPFAPLERKLRLALRRGSRRVEAVMDLHGMRQDQAHAALEAFLHRSAGQGASLVLVVTGKGFGKGLGKGSGNAATAARSFEPWEERGVLRRLVPHWLGLPPLRLLVAGFEEAEPNHGGSGALYVRLRRQLHSLEEVP